ncbi:kinase-associated protein B [Bacillus pakistanensis]|uniref:Kinase-associated protein B n=1 Tax=Rossellomorea pakistanensis TaxID=992288 RepID=A0ABS2NEL1_9BACI|nr:kinase-associated lipoprotein B [Bacillus pakistanensis]MBM7586253.1 kinase-associated protein B [Bacillus pakistanensis]
MSELKKGNIVTALYKTGKYIGEITETRSHHFVVKILAVLKHPRQGDLHHPKDVDVPLFHERKALAYTERANIPLKMVKPYDGEIDNYHLSLKKAFAELKRELTKESTPYSDKSLQALNGVQKEYELMYSIKM